MLMRLYAVDPIKERSDFNDTLRSSDSRLFFFFSSRRRHTRLQGDWSSDVCSSDLRLSTIREANEIVVLDAGAVVERGTHAELVALDGLYSHLIASQLGAGARWRRDRKSVV